MNSLPRSIEIGMDVFDRSHTHIGTVDDFKFPENATDPGVQPADIDGTDRPGRESILNSIAEVFGGDPVPEALHERLLIKGFVRIDADGFFAADRFITPEQIASADADGLVLNVDRDALVKD